MSGLLPDSEFSDEFVTMMKNRMLVSYHKYGSLRYAYPHKVDAIETLRSKLKQYKETGNRALLPDIANYAMIEFMYPSHENAHLDSNDQSKGRVTQGGRLSQEDNKEL